MVDQVQIPAIAPTPTPDPSPAAVTPLPVDSKITLSFSYLPLVIDYGLRWAVLEFWVNDILPSWVFWSMQLVLVPATAWLLALNREQTLRTKHQVNAVEAQGNGWSIIFSILVVTTGTFVVYSLANPLSNFLQIVISVLSFLIYGFYTATLYITSVKDEVWERPFSEYKDIDGPDDPEDENDVRIAIMETEVHSISHRVEAYTLESALFGALSFSGFTTLISSETKVGEGVHNLVNAVVATWNDNAGVVTAVRGILFTPRSDADLLATITIETLVCSLFFLLVILSRLRFYAVLKKVNFAVAIARAWNIKEEEVLHLRLEGHDTPEIRSRLGKATQKVAIAVGAAEPLLKDLTMMARYMWIFRTLGIGMFLIVIVTSAFLLSSRLAFCFLAVAVLAYSYAGIDKWMHNRRVADAGFFHTLRRRSRVRV